MENIPHIAIVDDDAAIRQSLTSLMRALGYSASAYPSAEAFLAVVVPGWPDALVTDLQMTGMSGLGLLSQLKSRGFDVPSIVITAFADEATRSACLKQGATAYLSKPTDSNEIANILAGTLIQS